VQSEVYRFPLVVTAQAVAWSFLGIIGAALISALLVRRRLDGLDLVGVLKIRE
jgi:putative ABC transport system permease protein